MKSLILITCQSEAKRRIRAKKRQMMARQAVRWIVRLATLYMAMLGVFVLVVPYASAGVTAVFVGLSVIPMMWGMEDME